MPAILPSIEGSTASKFVYYIVTTSKESYGIAISDHNTVVACRTNKTNILKKKLKFESVSEKQQSSLKKKIIIIAKNLRVTHGLEK